MATTALDLLMPVYRISVDEYERMGEIGLFDQKRVELIEGVIVEMSPIGRRHDRGVSWLTRTITLQLDDTVIVSPQGSIALPQLGSMPQPDLAVRTTAEMLGHSDDPLRLLVEVADSSLRYDRITKSRLYARAAIGEYWIVNVEEETVEVHTEPAGEFWGRRTVHGPEDTLEPVGLPGVGVALAPIFDAIAGRSG
ncbi:MAG: Uma2 family endonuclease [Solirubrobacterales bacterium]|nr:Uma2 family endonuclease [Solirubrobacterales bacterium]